MTHSIPDQAEVAFEYRDILNIRDSDGVVLCKPAPIRWARTASMGKANDVDKRDYGQTGK